MQEEEETESKLSKSSKNRWESLESTFKEEEEEAADEDEKEDESACSQKIDRAAAAQNDDCDQ